MNILVTNPTGRIGRKLVPELLAPEFSVRVIVRDPARLPQETRHQVEVVPGSTDDAATLRRALTQASRDPAPRRGGAGTTVTAEAA